MIDVKGPYITAKVRRRRRARRILASLVVAISMIGLIVWVSMAIRNHNAGTTSEWDCWLSKEEVTRLTRKHGVHYLIVTDCVAMIERDGKEIIVKRREAR